MLQQAWQDARTRQDRGQQLAAVVALGNAHWLLDRTNTARLFYDEGLHLAEVERNMTIEAMLRLRLAQLDGEEERLDEGIELGKRALFLSQTLRDAVTEAATLSLLADLYRKTGRSVEAMIRNSARWRFIAAVRSSCTAPVSRRTEPFHSELHSMSATKNYRCAVALSRVATNPRSINKKLLGNGLARGPDHQYGMINKVF